MRPTVIKRVQEELQPPAQEILPRLRLFQERVGDVGPLPLDGALYTPAKRSTIKKCAGYGALETDGLLGDKRFEIAT
ncbi:MAG TPA: hypothetical protein VHJ58_09745 [Vicinamibacterales bacterium]|jgi:hypothetical protein|nr:hypothetical protein [Vicinamibacterales bacterium]